jgi:hypothetical protein
MEVSLMFNMICVSALNELNGGFTPIRKPTQHYYYLAIVHSPPSTYNNMGNDK